MNNSKNNSFLIYLKGICITAVMLVTLMAFTNPERTKEQVVESEKVEEIATTEDLHKYIARNIKYPTEARQNNIEGKVVANVKVNNKGVVGKPKIGAAKGGDVVKIDELVVVAYEEPGAGSESVPEANQLLGTEVENVLTKLPKINNVDLQGKTLEFNVKFELQKKKTPSMVGRDVKVKNALGQEFTLLLTETGFTLEGPKTNQPAFVVDRKEVSLSVLKELNAEEVKIIGYGPIGNDLKGRISDSSNGSFTIITNDFYESKRNEIRVKPKGNPLYVLNDAVYKGEINDIDPENIHSISVIKGQKAVDKYGEEASDGVVEIITKEYAIEKGLPLDKGVLKTRTINVEGKGEASVVIDKKAWNKEPLFIVDGERVNANDVDNESIESVNVIKGQSAIDKYGEDAKNGVVEITTKLGAEKRKSSDAISIKSTDDIKFDQITISADSGSEPVYIVDGTRQYGQKVAAEDIESVNFIKGSNAIDKYGEDAKNGAVEFTTKEYENNVIPGQSLNSVKVVRYGSYAVDSKDSHPHFRIKSNTNGKKPLYVIDGEEVDGEVFENLDKKSIESMTVLKDKSAKDLYGEKARDGVIVITLKN